MWDIFSFLRDASLRGLLLVGVDSYYIETSQLVFPLVEPSASKILVPPSFASVKKQPQGEIGFNGRCKPTSSYLLLCICPFTSLEPKIPDNEVTCY